MTTPARRDRGLTALGVAALCFYAAHAGQYLYRRQAEHALWICHVGTILVGVGLLTRQGMLNAVGTVWLLVGLPLWLYDLSSGGEFVPTSTLTHGGGLLLGLAGSKRLGVPKGVWWAVPLGLIPVYFLCRWLTPAASNVNLSHEMYPGSEAIVSSYPVYIALLLGLFALAGLVFQGISRRLGCRPPEAP